MIDVTAANVPHGSPSPEMNRERYAAHQDRVARRAAQRAALLEARKKLAQRPGADTP